MNSFFKPYYHSNYSSVTGTLFNSSLYIGSKKGNWTPDSEKFLVGYKNRTSIFNIAVTNFFLTRAKAFVEIAIARGARGFFFGLFKSYSGIAPYLSKLGKLDQVASFSGWRGGFITNTKFFRSKLMGGSKKFSFVAAFRFDYAVFPVVNECKRMGLPLIAPVDSNSNASYLDYPIPGNSATLGSTYFLAREFLCSIYAGLHRRYRPKSSALLLGAKFGKLNSRFSGAKKQQRYRKNDRPLGLGGPLFFYRCIEKYYKNCRRFTMGGGGIEPPQ